MSDSLSEVGGPLTQSAGAKARLIDAADTADAADATDEKVGASAAASAALIELAHLFRLLGDPSRLSIVVACLHEPVCVSDLAHRTDLSQSLVSHHLRLLRGARVLRGERRGKQIFYVAADEHVRRMIHDMVEHVTECGEDGPLS